MKLVLAGFADFGPCLQADQKSMRFWKMKDRGMVRRTNSPMAPSGKVTFGVVGWSCEGLVRAVLLQNENTFIGLRVNRLI